jgi:lysophospholipase L1-like esterase
MSAALRTRGRLACLLALLVTALAAVPAARADSASPVVVPPKATYLALGDSLAYGYHQGLFNSEFPNVDATTFNHGYADDFLAAMTKLSNGQQQMINDGCPGETSDSMIDGGPVPGTCAKASPFPYAFLHHAYSGGSQLSDALAVIAAHPKQVNPITIDIGANDLLQAQTPCAIAGGGVGTPGFVSCIQGTIGHVATNLASILGQIRALAPNNEIIVMGLYNPQINLLPLSDQLVTLGFNPTMAGVAAQFGAFFADPFDAINHNPAFPNEIASVCSLTAVCSAADIHPTDAGYQAIADVIFQASGYADLK